MAEIRCPVCTQVMGKSRSPDGVELDVCDAHGVWLDRGELEKLIALASNEFDDDTPTRPHDPRLRERDDALGTNPDADRGRRYRRHDSDDGHFGDDDRSRDGTRPRGKRRWFEMFGDIFD